MAVGWEAGTIEPPERIENDGDQLKESRMGQGVELKAKLRYCRVIVRIERNLLRLCRYDSNCKADPTP